MRIFVTGATGFVGSAIVRELLAAGHEVLGLARSDASVASLESLGVQVQRGSIEDIESLKSGAAKSDAIVHTAFNHDFKRFTQSCEEDARAIDALGAALEGTARALIVTSALGALPQGVCLTEETGVVRGAGAHPRAHTELAVDAILARGVQVSVVRLPVTVHGEGDPHFVPMLIRIARQKGCSAYVDEGNNRWPAVHRVDAARLYRLILERRPSGGRYHAVAEEGIPLRDIATAIGRQLDVPVVSVPRSQAAQHFGGLAYFAGLDVPASSARTRDQTGWSPTQTKLLLDLEQRHYFAA